jgi:hypothetical protein
LLLGCRMADERTRKDEDNLEGNQAQRGSDAAPDAVADDIVAGEGPMRRNRTNTSDSSGIPADDERAGEIRKRLHDQGFDPNVG